MTCVVRVIFNDPQREEFLVRDVECTSYRDAEKQAERWAEKKFDLPRTEFRVRAIPWV